MINLHPDYLILFPTYNQLRYVYLEVSYMTQLGIRRAYRDRDVIVYDWANVWFGVSDFVYSKLHGMRYEEIAVYRPNDQPTISISHIAHFAIDKNIRTFVVPEEVTKWLENIRSQSVNRAR